MSIYEFKLPDIGEGVMEGEVVNWLVQLGDRVAEDQPMVEVMTDKATVTITSPKAGTVVKLGGKIGEIIPVHSVLVVLELSNGQAASESDADAKADDEGPAATAVGDIRESLPGMGLAAAPVAAPQVQAGAAVGGASGYFNAKPLATPATRKLARDLGVDLRTVTPSGPHGRVLKSDVQSFNDTPTGPSGAQAGQIESPPRATPPAAPLAVAPPARPEQQAMEERTPLRGMRKRIFESMARSKHTAAHFTFVEECDVTALKRLRERLKPKAAEHDVRLTYLPFFVKAVVAALKQHPSLNSAYDEATGEIVTRRYYNIGIASATAGGLMVPVVFDADRKSVMAIAREIQELGEQSKAGRIAADRLRGSTFTITSLGSKGGLFATPILNTPEVGILGIHQIKQKPVVRDGEIVVGDVMLLSLSFDHRIIDGHIGAAFAYSIIELLEDPDRLWLEMG
jgi:pyruvate dehydrogenase E2 component (dihydrolipoamide acetyltransferase)